MVEEKIKEVAKDPWMVKILKYLLDQGVVHTAQVARGVHIATTTAHKYLERMVEDGLVVANKVGVGKPVYWTVRKVDKVSRIVYTGTVKSTIAGGKITLDVGRKTYGVGKKTFDFGKNTTIGVGKKTLDVGKKTIDFGKSTTIGVGKKTYDVGKKTYDVGKSTVKKGASVLVKKKPKEEE